MTQGEDYAANGREFLGKAQEALAQGDLAQASEKGWGAAAQIVKAVAEQRGWSHSSHRELFQVVRRLAEEYSDPQLRTLFHVANSLHNNFYENWLPEEFVQSGLQDIRALVAKLQALLR